MQAIITELDRKHLRTGSRHDSWWKDQVLLWTVSGSRHLMLLQFMNAGFPMNLWINTVAWLLSRLLSFSPLL